MPLHTYDAMSLQRFYNIPSMSIPKSHEVVKRRVVKNTVLKSGNLSACRKGLTRTLCTVQHTVSFIAYPCPTPTGIFTKNNSYLNNRSKYFSQYCLAMQMFVLLHVSICFMSQQMQLQILLFRWFEVCKQPKMYIELHNVKVLFYSLYYIKQKSLCI